DENPHPELSETFVADLRELHTFHRNYGDRENPPVLHRKECFVADEYPLRKTFAALTQSELDAGLLSDSGDIGTRSGWESRLTANGYIVRGHELLRADSEA